MRSSKWRRQQLSGPPQVRVSAALPRPLPSTLPSALGQPVSATDQPTQPHQPPRSARQGLEPRAHAFERASGRLPQPTRAPARSAPPFSPVAPHPAQPAHDAAGTAEEGQGARRHLPVLR